MNTMESKRLSLKPSRRDNRRYFVVRSTHERVEQAILDYVGVLGFAKAAYVVAKVPEIAQGIVGSCVAEELHHVRAALGLAGIEMEKVSGTIAGLKG